MNIADVTIEKLPYTYLSGFGITDINGVNVNPIPGEMVKANRKLFVFQKIVRRVYTTTFGLATEALCYHLKEYLFPEGWVKLAWSQERLERLMEANPPIEKMVLAKDFNAELETGKMTWWWVV